MVPGRPCWALLWTWDTEPAIYGNLYSRVLDVVSAALMVYVLTAVAVLTIAALFRLRWSRLEAPRPHPALGSPLVPALSIAFAVAILAVLSWYRTAATWPGVAIGVPGKPIYVLWRKNEGARA